MHSTGQTGMQSAIPSQASATIVKENDMCNPLQRQEYSGSLPDTDSPGRRDRSVGWTCRRRLLVPLGGCVPRLLRGPRLLLSYRTTSAAARNRPAPMPRVADALPVMRGEEVSQFHFPAVMRGEEASIWRRQPEC